MYFSKEAGADYVKTSTGFSTGGAKPEDIKLMRETVGKIWELKLLEEFILEKKWKL